MALGYPTGSPFFAAHPPTSTQVGFGRTDRTKSMQANVRRETARRIDPKGVYG
jgi:hypothetical protein